jgi:glycosyltransferase involved in cell wall biosynthesis
MTPHKPRVLLVSIAPPLNDCGVRVVLHRHLVERNPFELHVVTNADFYSDTPSGTKLTLPYPLQRLRKTRFGPRLSPWLTDYENLVWTLTIPRALDKAILDFKPDVILTLAETSLCHLAAKAAKKHRLPLAGLFLDWFPSMKPHYGHAWTKNLLSRRYRALYQQCDLAFCTSDGMQEVLGPHPNSHVIYPMPGRHQVPKTVFPPKSGKFRLVYVGSVENFYGRMLCSLIEKMESLPDLEIIVVGPNADWPADILQRAKTKGIYLGFKPPEEAAAVLAGADALLVVMSFEPEHRLFMETSFTTKFLDYTAFGKPIILWGPEYCAPVRVARRDGGALVVDKPEPDEVLAVCRKIASDLQTRENLANQAKHLHEDLFNPDRLQDVFVSEIEKLTSLVKT